MAYISFSTAFGRMLFIEFVPFATPTHYVENHSCHYIYAGATLIGVNIPQVPVSLELVPGVMDEITPSLQSWLMSFPWHDGIRDQLTISGGYQVVDIRSSDLIEGTHLHDCVVDDGHHTYRLICGAANAVPGLRSVLAHQGTRLVTGQILAPTVIHGVSSAEMLCSLNDLGLASLATKRGIMELDPTQWAVGQHITRREVEDIYAKRTRG